MQRGRVHQDERRASDRIAAALTAATAIRGAYHHSAVDHHDHLPLQDERMRLLSALFIAGFDNC
jgi:hypothetical protein